MARSLLSLSIHLYGAAAIAYLVYLIRQWAPVPWVGRALVGAGIGLHATSMAMTLAAQGGMPVGMAQGFSLLALLMLAVFFALDLRYRMPVIGAFLMPIALAALIPGLLLSGGTPPTEIHSFLPVHIVIAMAGMAAFGIASGVAVMYLLMERQMKRKKFGVLFSRLPSLQFLDDLNRQLLLWGFIALSVTVVTGALFAQQAAGVLFRFNATEIATFVAWAVFAGLLNARIFAGWRGKRVALLTMAGFCILLVSFFTSYDPGRMAGLH